MRRVNPHLKGEMWGTRTANRWRYLRGFVVGIVAGL
jgi:hypothetical protein